MAAARVAFFAISMVLLSSVAMATEYTVGDGKGWAPDYNYTEWTQNKVFHVGDSLLFSYNSSNHNVFKVNGTFFQDCTIPPINEALTSGKDVVQLQNPGKKWYICGVADHCAARQMKLVINVLADAPAPAPSAAHSVVSSLSGVLMMAATVAIAAIFA